MTKNIKFSVFRQKRSNLPHRSIAVCSVTNNILTMAELQRIVDIYAKDCKPVFKGEDRPMVEAFYLDFDDHMYNAYLIAEG